MGGRSVLEVRDSEHHWKTLVSSHGIIRVANEVGTEGRGRITGTVVGLL